MSDYKETEVSNVPWLDPDKEIKMTAEPQAKSGLGGHAVPQPGHLVTYSPEGVGEKNGGKNWVVGEKEMYPDDVPPDAPPTKVVAGGGTVGPQADESTENAARNATFTTAAPTAETSDPTVQPTFADPQSGNPEGTSPVVALNDMTKTEYTDEYDVSAYNVEEVKEFVTAHPDQREAVLKAEQADKNRVTLVEWLTNYEPAGAGAGDTTSKKGN